MFPRVTHPSATDVLLHPFDLHVLSLPPAFVLSQDQTLRFMNAVLFTVEPHYEPDFSLTKYTLLTILLVRYKKKSDLNIFDKY